MNSEYQTSDPDKHITEAVPFFQKVGLPAGFKPVLTKDVKEGDTVYLMGTKAHKEEASEAAAYGPHTVVAQQQFPARVWLKNKNDRKFPVNQEELLLAL